MGKRGIADFKQDLAFAERARVLLNGFYESVAKEGKFVPLERSPGSIWIQRNAHVDCILSSRRGGSVTIEEKIVRWPGYKYSAMTLETHSNLERTQEDDIGDGWMKTSTADILLCAFEGPEGGLTVWAFDLPMLREWFFANFENYPIADTSNRYYTTRCRVVPMAHVPAQAVLVREHCISARGRSST